MTSSLLSIGIIALAVVLVAACRVSGAELPATGAKSPLEFTIKANDGTDHALSQYKGKVVMLVNVASKCGFTKQYAGLQKLYADHQAKGFVIIGVPANDFMGQEPGTDADIKTFYQTKFGVTFPLMAKVVVAAGETQAPLYRYLTKESPFPGKISWNFNKFLIGRDGQVVARFGSQTTPDDAELLAAVDKALAAGDKPLAAPTP